MILPSHFRERFWDKGLSDVVTIYTMYILSTMYKRAALGLGETLPTSSLELVPKKHPICREGEATRSAHGGPDSVWQAKAKLKHILRHLLQYLYTHEYEETNYAISDE